MLTINKLRSDSAIDYAAEELKKYLRMMMPDGGDVKICYNPDAKDGFRLGLFEDFGLPFSGEDATLDDELHIETDTQGGILAGSNPRSVLFSVYRYLRENGCRWLYPGVDGDHIPMKDIEPISYHKLADYRMRGFCDEGHPTQQMMLDCIDYYAKLELNAFSLEFFLPNGYYGAYYDHYGNEANRKPEPVSDEQILQWRRQCEVEINKRGMMLPSIGHGWTCRALGFPSEHRNVDINDFTEEQRSWIALVNGKREFFDNKPVLSQVCLSNPTVRSKIADEVVRYSKTHSNITDMMFALGDSANAQCECEECRKMNIADWSVMLMNEIDEKLTTEGLNTRVCPNMYLDTYFPPEKMKLNNPKRFAYVYAPITRDYTVTITKDTPLPPAPKYELNNNVFPNTEELYALLKQWQKVYDGDLICFDYHFWRSQYIEPGQQALSRRLYEDVRALKDLGINNMLEDGSQRSGFPNGFMSYIYAETLMDRNCDFDKVREDYFQHIYGADWEKVLKILENLSTIFEISYMQDLYQVSITYKKPGPMTPKDLDRLPKFRRVHDLAAELRLRYDRRKGPKTRTQTVSWNLLYRFSQFCDMFADIMIARVQGHIYEAKELGMKMKDEFGKYEMEIEKYYDHALAMEVISRFLFCINKLEVPVD